MIEVLAPSGGTEIEHLHAARVADLSGKTVAMISDDMWQAHRMLPLVKAALERQFDGIAVLPETQFPMGSNAIDTEETVDKIIAAGADAVIVGNAA